MRRCKTPRCKKRPAKARLVCPCCRMREWRKKHPLKAAYAKLRDHARGRGIEFNLPRATFEKLATITGYITQSGLFGQCLTIDRKDNTKGYVIGNVQVMTRSKNTEKQMKYDEKRHTAGNAWRYRG